MARLPLPIIKGDKISPNIDYRDQLPVNLIGVPEPHLGASGYLITHDGIESFSTGLGLDRGAVYNERLGLHFRVSGTRLITVDGNGVINDLGEITGTDQVSMPYSFNSQAIIADGKYYRYTTALGLQQITDPDVGTPIDATWVDQYYFFTDGETLYHTNIADESQIDPADFATSEFSPDPTVGVERDYDNTVIAFNRYTTEYFVNDATTDFAFRRISSRAKSIGIVGTHCKTPIQGNWFILGGSKEEQPTIYIMNTSSKTKVATREVDLILSQYTEEQLSKVVCESRFKDDVQLVYVRLPDRTLVYNLSVATKISPSAAWSFVRDEITTDGSWPCANGVYDPRNDSWVYGDTGNTRLGKINRDIATIYGTEIETICYSPMIKIEGASIDELEIETTPGATQQQVKVFVSTTYDGVIFGQEYLMQYGSANDYNQRFIRYRFGYVSDKVGFKFRCVSRGKLTYQKLEIEYA